MCIFAGGLGNPANGGPKLLQYRPMTVQSGGSRVSKLRVGIRVSIRIRVSLCLVIGWG